MKRTVKRILREFYGLAMGLVTSLPGYWSGHERRFNETLRAETDAWESQGRPSPPPHHIKQQIVLGHAEQFNVGTFVETGTLFGDMVEATRRSFGDVYSIELSRDLHRRVRSRFRGIDNVHLIQGDSGRQLYDLVPTLKEPAIFWLDGHYSGGPTAQGDQDTPIIEELRAVLNPQSLDHVILIDDARLFGADPAYPTVEYVERFVTSIKPTYSVSVEDDCIRVLPPLPAMRVVG